MNFKFENNFLLALCATYPASYPESLGFESHPGHGYYEGSFS